MAERPIAKPPAGGWEWVQYGEALEARLAAYERVAEAGRDPFLVILESHPDADPPANAEMKRAADRFRAALSALDTEGEK